MAYTHKGVGKYPYKAKCGSKCRNLRIRGWKDVDCPKCLNHKPTKPSKGEDE